MSSTTATNDNDSNSGARIKSAASALLKGGTLVSEPCPKCGGVQVKAADRTSCINCGNETSALEQEQMINARDSTTTAPEPGFAASAAIIEYKISELASGLRDEKDMAIQRQKAELLEAYLRIFEKMRALATV
ncbi:MAG TPA: Sjogren's syndrome/scleroderma autoantigen 1 family protein [Nitrososphaera sp.]|nr:Sjogren's syndrome/scleroderma autoantigen 1 family protein [Nitrososphaera sp.]